MRDDFFFDTVTETPPDWPVAGKEKLGVPTNEAVRLVLESDGTQVEDGEYFRTLPNNSVLLLLRPGERWRPPGVDIFRAGEWRGDAVCSVNYRSTSAGRS